MLIVGGYGIFYAYKENDQQKSSTKAVLLNKDFRQSLGFAIGRTNYAAQLNGKESANTAVRNIFVKPDFFQADGKDFGTMVMDQLPAYGILQIVKMVFTIQKKLRLSSRKLRKPFKQKEFSSRFIWTFQ